MVRRIAVLLSVGLVACVGGPSEDAALDTEDVTLGHTSQALATDVTVYSNTSLTSPWQNWSWSATTAFGNADAPLVTGSTSQIKTTVTAAWGSLSLARGAGDLSIADYDSVSFDIRGTTSQTVYALIETLAGASGSEVTVPVTTTWTTKTIKLADLKGSLSAFAKLDFMGPTKNKVFYIDNVKLVAKAVTPPPPSTTFPTNPLAVTKNDVVNLTFTGGSYSVYVPTAYDATHNTPAKVLLWMHGCGGDAYGDAWEVSPGGTQSWVSVSVGGRDGACWDPNVDTSKITSALANVKTRLNVDPKRVVIGGYSSGGDMAYRTAFYNAGLFAGLIAENTSPFRDTGSTQAQSLAAASWKLNVAHLAHLQDTTYPVAGVRTETGALTTAGYPITRIEKNGTHWDDDTATTGTTYDLRTFLLPYLNAGWVTP